ncbi:MAG: hypothetical protein KC912_02610 [Proteobacteria bacterium]|nr:hypothetical protein [Pseudomonadota bacterium]
MAYRLNLGALRGMDALTLEITIQDALRRPLSGVEPSTLADLMALGESDVLSASVRPGLDTFVGRMPSEISDLPSTGFASLVHELNALGAARIPETLRGAVLSELGRDSRMNEQRDLSVIVKSWADIEATPFEISAQAPRVARAPEARRNDARFQGARTAPRGEPATKTKRASKTPQARSLDLSSSTDLDRDRYLEQACQERLVGVSEKGLLEAVLIAGVRHGARSRYPELGGHEVKSALQRLLKRGAARFSAGRWSHAGRRY